MFRRIKRAAAALLDRVADAWQVALQDLDTSLCDECMGWPATELVDVPAGGLAEVCAYCADTLVDNAGAKRVARNG